jgi:hypothetical protein
MVRYAGVPVTPETLAFKLAQLSPDTHTVHVKLDPDVDPAEKVVFPSEPVAWSVLHAGGQAVPSAATDMTTGTEWSITVTTSFFRRASGVGVGVGAMQFSPEMV